MTRLMGYTKMSDAVGEYVRHQLSVGTPVDSIAFDLRTAFVASMPDNEIGHEAALAMVCRVVHKQEEVK